MPYLVDETKRNSTVASHVTSIELWVRSITSNINNDAPHRLHYHPVQRSLKGAYIEPL